SAGGGGNNLPGSAGPGGTGATSSIFQTENQVQINANGTRNISNSYQIDGVEVNSLAWGGAAVITPNEESVKEVRIISNNYSAVNTGTGWYEKPEFLKGAAAASSIAGNILSFPGEGASFNAIIPKTCAQIGLPATQCHDTSNGLDLGSPLTSALGTRDPTFGQ